MSISKGFLKAIGVMSFAYGIFTTAEHIEQGKVKIDTSGIKDKDRQEYQELISEYRKGLTTRLYGFMKKYSGYHKKMQTMTESIIHKTEPILFKQELDLDLLAIYILEGLSNKEKVSDEVKEVISKDDIDNLLYLVKSNYERVLKLGIEHRRVANRILEELL